MSFGERYGGLGEGFIEVHRVKPVADYGGDVSVDPETDMALLCPNCHRTPHRGPEGPLTVEELRQVLGAGGMG
jgi:5-methylcytosine-specific restriction protein A